MKTVHAMAGLATLSIVISNQALAEPEKPLAAEIEVGIITTTGNTETQSYKGKLDVTQNFENWKNNYVLTGLYKSEEVDQEVDGETTSQDRTSAEKYFGSVKSDYKLDKEHAGFFAYAEYDRDRFSGFDYQYTVAVGYSDRFFTRDNSYFAYDVGPGYTVNRPETPAAEPGEPTPQQPDENESFIVRVALDYLYEFSENAKFTQKISSNINPDSDKNTKTRSVSAISAKINGSFTLRAAFTVDYNDVVPADRKHADTETSLAIVYSL